MAELVDALVSDASGISMGVQILLAAPIWDNEIDTKSVNLFYFVIEY